MSLDIAAVQRALREQTLDGWLWYDFQGTNPIAVRLAGLAGTSKLTTRRWFYFIPADGEPRGLVHAIERGSLDALPGAKMPYAGRLELDTGLRRLLEGARRIAMEYSPRGAIPYVSRVDAGTIELVRQHGVEVVSSGDLIQQFEARWSDAQIASHHAASEKLHRIKDQAFAAVAERLHARTPTTEYDLQQLMWRWFQDEGLTSDAAPMVAVDDNASNPHYVPEPERSRALAPGQLLMVDLWGKTHADGAVFADITWMAYTGRRVPEEMARAFSAVREARDAAIALVEDAARQSRPIRGYEVDRRARQVLDEAGYGAYLLHRTGHSLGQTVHGNGAHLDDYETHDERHLLPRTGFTIEPGIYLGPFGVRTEINMVWTDDGPQVTGPRQQEIVTLG